MLWVFVFMQAIARYRFVHDARVELKNRDEDDWPWDFWRAGHSGYSEEKWCWGSSGPPSELSDWSSITVVEFKTRPY